MENSFSPDTNQPHPAKQIIILSGQSNMAGRGGVKNKQWDGVVPPECAPDSQKIFRLDAHLRWEVAREPLHHDIDTKKTCGVGPGMSFANAVKERVGTIGLVPCAVGGTAIKEWARGEHLYENMVKRAKAASSGGEVKALLWYQGESDTSSQHDVDAYKQNMETFIHNVRTDLNLPNLPIVQVSTFYTPIILHQTIFLSSIFWKMKNYLSTIWSMIDLIVCGRLHLHLELKVSWWRR